jgi:hypothetical protein
MAQPRQQKKMTAMQKANRALSIVNKLSSSIERKYQITEFNSAQISSAGALFALNETVPGDSDFGERSGDRIRCVRFEVRLQVSQPTAILNTHAIRILIVVDKQSSMANASQLLLGVATPESPMLPFSKDYRLRTALLYDSHSIPLDTYNPTSMVRRINNIDLKTQFLLGTDRITTGKLLAVMITDMPTGSPDYPRVTGTIRVDYTDA